MSQVTQFKSRGIQEADVFAAADPLLAGKRPGRLLDHLPARPAGSCERHPRTRRASGYVLVYDLAGDSIRMLRVLHTARLWPPQKPGYADPPIWKAVYLSSSR